MKRRIFGIALITILLATIRPISVVQAMDEEPPVPDPQSTGSILQHAFAIEGDFSLAPYVDIVITDIHASQGGYQEPEPTLEWDDANWQAVIEVTNFGTASTGHFEIVGEIGRIPFGELSIIWNPTVSFGEIDNLDPGEYDEIISPMYDFSGLALDVNNVPGGSWISNLPNHSEIHLRAIADHFFEVDESDDSNNTAVATFIYPSAPHTVIYDSEQDQDGDGVYPPDDCYDDDPTIHQGAVDTLGDYIDQDCAGGPDYSLVPGHCDFIDGFDIDNDGDGYTERQGDCCDSLSNIHPGADEVENESYQINIDDDCDGLIDEGILFPDPLFLDVDGDGYTPADGDCDDYSTASNPGAHEIDDGLDNDCDGWANEYWHVPDWEISNFIVWRDHSDCRQPYTHVEEWGNESCGLRYVWYIDNLGEDLGQGSTELIRGMTYMTDFVRDYYLDVQQSPITGTTIYGEGYFPYYGYAFQTPGMLDLMACGPVGFNAVIPGSELGGPFGDQNLSNNNALDYPPENDEGIDIKFSGELDFDIFYPINADNQFQIFPHPVIEGACPPPEIVDYTTRVRVLLNDSLIHEQEKPLFGRNIDMDAKPPNFVFPIQNRPQNDDEIVIEILVNSDGRVAETNTENNLCRIELRYDRGGIGGWSNDALILEHDPVGCEGIVNESGVFPGPMPQSHTGALTGGINVSTTVRVVLIALGMFFGISLAIGGWVLAPRLTLKLAKIVLRGASVILLGGSIIGGAVSGLRKLPDVSDTTLLNHRKARAEKLGLLADKDQDILPVSCSGLFDSVMVESLSEAGFVEDLTIKIDPKQGFLPPDSRFRITIWDNWGYQNTLTTGDTSFSLSSAGLYSVSRNPYLWQVQAESPVSADESLYNKLCIPEIHSSLIGSLPEQTEDLVEEDDQEVTPTPEKYIPSPTKFAPPTPEKDIQSPTKSTPPTSQPTSTKAPPPKDTSGPKISGAAASPNPGLTTTPVTITTNISDGSGVASATVYYRSGKGGYQLAGNMKSGGGNQYFLSIGALTPAGTYIFKIVANDTLGNTNCSTGALDSCPGGTFSVNIP